jgi:radical SAM superfamily enzyme YgiQ (UPF0313 family)
VGARETPTDVLLVQAAIRHPQDDHLHNRAFNRYFSSMRRLAAAMDFNSLVTRAVPSPPTTMLSLAAYLRAQRIRVAVADLNLSFLADGITPETELITRLEQDRPRILAIGAMESYLLEAVYRLARTARDYDPGLYIVVGGVNATAIDAAILKTGKVDAVVRGEGEETLTALCRTVLAHGDLRNVEGISHRHEGQVVRNPDRPFLDLATLPLPARDIYPLARMYALNGGVDAVYGSRGCPAACLFCHGPNFWKRQWRGRPPGEVVRELGDIATQGGRVALLYDMNFGHRPAWALEIARQIEQAPWHLTWGCELRVDHLLDRAFLEALYRAGCHSVFVGLESTDPLTLAGIDKGYTCEALETALSNAARVGIGVEATVMIGLPEDTATSIRQTTDAVLDLFHDGRLKLVHYFLCVPWAGTALGDRPEDYGVEVVCRNPANLITAPSIPLASTRRLAPDAVYALWEEGVERLDAAVKQKLMLIGLKQSFVTEVTGPCHRA